MRLWNQVSFDRTTFLKMWPLTSNSDSQPNRIPTILLLINTPKAGRGLIPYKSALSHSTWVLPLTRPSQTEKEHYERCPQETQLSSEFSPLPLFPAAVFYLRTPPPPPSSLRILSINDIQQKDTGLPWNMTFKNGDWKFAEFLSSCPSLSRLFLRSSLSNAFQRL